MTEKLPKISVVTANYNGGRFLEQTIQSIVNQSYPNLEYIIYDGGSKDDSVDIIKKYEKHLKFWTSERDGGHADALNKAFAKTTGDILCWLNSDDKYLPWTFKVVSEIFLQHADVHWIIGRPSVWNEMGDMVNVSPQLFNKFTFVVSPFKLMQQESVFFTRSLWERAGGRFDESIRYMIDSELWSRFFEYEDVYNVSTILGGFRHHDENRSKKFFDQCLAEHARCQSNLLQKSSTSFKRSVVDVKNAYRMRHSRLTRYLNFRSLGSIFLNRAMNESQYKLLIHDGTWIKKNEPFDFA